MIKIKTKQIWFSKNYLLENFPYMGLNKIKDKEVQTGT